MSEASQTGRRIRFGPYEADVPAGELRKNGRVLRLQEQPFQILAALLDRPGEVVTRDQLRERVWAGDTFVDFDQGLNTAINKLREALGDSAANPRFIETLPKRGYRFLFPVEVEPAGVAGEPAENAREGGQRIRLKLKFFPAAVAVLMVTATGFAVLWLRPSPPDTHTAVRRFSIRPPAPIPTMPYFVPFAVISPNGRHIAFVAGEADRKLWIQDLDQQQPRVIEGSEGAEGPFWSPDSNFIGFAARGELKKVSAKDGPPTRISALPQTVFFNATWSPDGQSIVFSIVSTGGPSGLYQVPASGGAAKILLSAETVKASADETSLHRNQGKADLYNPHFLPREAGPPHSRFRVRVDGFDPHDPESRQWPHGDPRRGKETFLFPEWAPYVLVGLG